MTQRILAAGLLALLAGCASTREATENLEVQVLELKGAYAQLQVATAAGASDADLAALEQRIKDEMADVKDAKDALVAAGKSDFQGLMGFAKDGIPGGTIGLGLTALAWFMRDRRKKLGRDPLQRTDVATPPTIGTIS